MSPVSPCHLRPSHPPYLPISIAPYQRTPAPALPPLRLPTLPLQGLLAEVWQADGSSEAMLASAEVSLFVISAETNSRGGGEWYTLRLPQARGALRDATNSTGALSPPGGGQPLVRLGFSWADHSNNNGSGGSTARSSTRGGSSTARSGRSVGGPMWMAELGPAPLPPQLVPLPQSPPREVQAGRYYEPLLTLSQPGAHSLVPELLVGVVDEPLSPSAGARPRGVLRYAGHHHDQHYGSSHNQRTSDAVGEGDAGPPPVVVAGDVALQKRTAYSLDPVAVQHAQHAVFDPKGSHSHNLVASLDRVVMQVRASEPPGVASPLSSSSISGASSSFASSPGAMGGRGGDASMFSEVSSIGRHDSTSPPQADGPPRGRGGAKEERGGMSSSWLDDLLGEMPPTCFSLSLIPSLEFSTPPPLLPSTPKP